MPLNSMYANGGTPLQSMLGNFMQAKQQTQTRNLMAPAMSGDQQALAQLMSVNPDAGMQVHDTLQKQNQFAMQQKMQESQLAMQQDQMALEEKKLNMPLPPIKLGEGETLVDPHTFKPIAGASPEGLTTKQADAVTGINKEITSMEKDNIKPFEDQYTLVKNSLDGVTDLSKLPPAKQMAVTMAYMKTLNPTRQNEISTEGIKDMKDVQGRMEAWEKEGFNVGALKDIALGKLTPSQITDMANAVSQRRNSAWEQHLSAVKPYYSTTASYLGEDKSKKLLPDYSGYTPARLISDEKKSAASPQDQQAIQWAQANKNDPRAAKILQLHGMQ